jgi:hypothetical protein
MSEIFISYKKEDRDRVAKIVDGLREEGLDVWWDQDIGPGQPWDQTVAAKLEGARCVVAVWSTLSVAAPWVKEEAGAGKQRGILVPVRIHDVDPPLGFGLIQAADLRFWKGDRTDKAWTDFAETVRRILRGETVPLLERARRRATNRVVFGAIAAVGVLAAASLGVSLFLRSGSQPQASASEPAITPTSAPVAAAAPSAQEQEAWAAALQAKTRATYTAYLATYPQGRFAADAQAAIRSCRGIEDVRYEPFEQRANVVGVTRAGAFGSREDAALSARDEGRQRAEERCAALAETAGGLEDVETHAQPVASTPQCLQPGPTSWTCNQQFWVTCTARKPVRSTREVCG